MRNTSDGIARMASKSRSLAGIMEDDFKFLTCTCSQGVAVRVVQRCLPKNK